MLNPANPENHENPVKRFFYAANLPHHSRSRIAVRVRR
jgi:hypothetical protein